MHRSPRLLLFAMLSTLIPLLAFAQPMPRRYRDNDRVTMEGRVSTMQHERDGYRVELDRGGYSFWVPERALRDRRNDFRIGASIRLGGIFRGGIIRVDVVEWIPLDNHPWQREEGDFVRGRIVRIDFGHEYLMLREERTGRTIRADLRRLGDPLDYRDFQRGELVRLSGRWTRDGDFAVYRIQHSR